MARHLRHHRLVPHLPPFLIFHHLTSRSRLLSTRTSRTMPPKNKYTNPKLRDEVKKNVQESDKGGAPGQWSARKVSGAVSLSPCMVK